MKAVEYNEQQKQFVDAFNKDHQNALGKCWNFDYDFGKLPKLEQTEPLKIKANIIKDIKKSIKEHYLKEQEYQCVYCKQKNLTNHNRVWDIEHIVDKDEFGIFTFEPLNLCVSCPECNGADGKATKKILKNPIKAKKPIYPKKGESYKIVHPHFDEYSIHIEIKNEGHNSLVFKAKTPKGRATIEVCGLIRFNYKYSNYNLDNIEDIDRAVELANELKNDPALYADVRNILKKMEK